MPNDFIVPVTCRLCNKTTEIHCNKNDFDSWQKGDGFIQDLLHYVSAADRELLISGTCGECFNELFSPTDEDED